MTRPGDGESQRGEQDVVDSTGTLEPWVEVWSEDRPFAIRTHRSGLLGRLLVVFKKLARPLVRAPQADLWERQRVFNLALLRRLEALALAEEVARVSRDLQQVQGEIVGDLRLLQREINADLQVLSRALDDFKRQGMVDVMRHADALFARLDQKVDRVGRLAASLQAKAPRKAKTDKASG